MEPPSAATITGDRTAARTKQASRRDRLAWDTARSSCSSLSHTPPYAEALPASASTRPTPAGSSASCWIKKCRRRAAALQHRIPRTRSTPVGRGAGRGGALRTPRRYGRESNAVLSRRGPRDKAASAAAVAPLNAPEPPANAKPTRRHKCSKVRRVAVAFWVRHLRAREERNSRKMEVCSLTIAQERSEARRAANLGLSETVAGS